MVAGAEQGGDREVHRRHAARGADRADAGLERRQPLLQHRRGRVGDAGVDVPGPLQVEQRGRVVGVLEDERRRLIDRNGARAGHRVGMLAGMQAQRFKGRWLRCGHRYLSISSGGRMPHRFDAEGSLAQTFGRCGWSRCHGRGSK